MARRLGILLACMLLLASPVIADDDANEQGKRLDEIVRLTQEGVADAIIVKHIAAGGFIFYLSADDILELRALNVSDVVIEALIDTGVSQQPPRRTNRIEYEPDTSLYVGISTGYFSPWYWYPYAWGFYYDPFPSYYSYYYYPFGCSSWGYYGYCNNYYYNDCWRSYRYDHWPYYNELARRRGGAVNVPVEGRGGTEFAVARARRPAAGVTTPAGAPRRLARSESPVRRDATPHLDAARRTRSRIHTRDAAAGQAVNAPRSTRRWSTPPPQAREVSRPAERRGSATPTRHLQPSSGGMHVRQGSSAAAPGRAPSYSAPRAVSSPAGRSPAPARSAPSSGSRLKFR